MLKIKTGYEQSSNDDVQKFNKKKEAEATALRTLSVR